ncbi:hypothetical protein AOQ84DRAFT_46633 [Glonium stellatum]|uniref:Mid2 domain-containing protein n=1 Tax=Glonium stellatum TaxID=574774 RepID=A0A8E2F081_9PEZI|nr:hypothetical protein AOQ84DRAFT_46633 [Glonium stellatum]
MRLIISLFLSIHAWKTASAASQTCYLPNKVISAGDVPCNLSADFSSCCDAEGYCLDNGLCYDHTGTISQGSCTDPNWENSNCFQNCKEAKSGLPIAATGLFISLETGERTFCCDVGTYDTANGSCLYSGTVTQPFTIPFGHIITDRSTGSIAVYNSSNIQPPNSTETANSTQAAHTSTVTVTASATGSSSSVTGKDTAIGVGLGVPLGLALIGTLALLWREKKKSAGYKAQLGATGEARGGWAGSPMPQYAPQYQYQSMGQPNPHELGPEEVGEMDAAQYNELGGQPKPPAR